MKFLNSILSRIVLVVLALLIQITLLTIMNQTMLIEQLMVLMA